MSIQIIVQSSVIKNISVVDNCNIQNSTFLYDMMFIPSSMNVHLPVETSYGGKVQIRNIGSKNCII